ncbi:hypothetical protein HAX54_005315 [Datura stramonium]|uniref:Uncharacterized protein n=1 Tax=Datura stramonium TaxID=4076 RepID=A0ABS8WVT6_DATST|nr:hypothetical protein [Datura stramonium]
MDGNGNYMETTNLVPSLCSITSIEDINRIRHLQHICWMKYEAWCSRVEMKLWMHEWPWIIRKLRMKKPLPSEEQQKSIGESKEESSSHANRDAGEEQRRRPEQLKSGRDAKKGEAEIERRKVASRPEQPSPPPSSKEPNQAVAHRLFPPHVARHS